MEPERPIRVAIVGSGMAGLITAFLLNRDPHKRYIVKIFESVRKFYTYSSLSRYANVV
jgi:2-polyprenyl-6-methoxyphenol hydroxylase-like FAD-dependent oxidoreductase